MGLSLKKVADNIDVKTESLRQSIFLTFSKLFCFLHLAPLPLPQGIALWSLTR